MNMQMKLYLLICKLGHDPHENANDVTKYYNNYYVIHQWMFKEFFTSEKLFIMKLTELVITSPSPPTPTSFLFLWLYSFTWNISKIIIQTFLNSDLGSITKYCEAAFPRTPLSTALPSKKKKMGQSIWRSRAWSRSKSTTLSLGSVRGVH